MDRCVMRQCVSRLLAAVLVLPGVALPQGRSDSSAVVAATGASVRVGADTTPPDTTFTYAAAMHIAEVVSAAIQNSPSMAQAVGALRVGQSGDRVAYGEFLPFVTLNAAGMQSGQHSLSGATLAGSFPSQSYSAGIAASYELFTGGRREADIAAARATTRSANAGLVQQRYAVTLLAKETFFADRRARDLVRVSTDAVVTADRALQYAEARMRRGTATRADVLLARLNLTTARQQLIAARDTLTTNAYALGRLVGVPGAVAAEGTDSLPSVALAMPDSAVVALAVGASPGVRAADEFARASDASLHAASTQYVPDVKLIGGYTWANNSIAFSAVRPGWVVELATSYPLFNGFIREDDVTRASAAAHTARVTATDERRFARAEAERLLAAVRFAWENIAEAEEGSRVAEENFRVVSVRYQNGVATFLDLSTAQLDEAQARVALVTARYTYQIARASLEALVGRDL